LNHGLKNVTSANAKKKKIPPTYLSGHNFHRSQNTLVLQCHFTSKQIKSCPNTFNTAKLNTAEGPI